MNKNEIFQMLDTDRRTRRAAMRRLVAGIAGAGATAALTSGAQAAEPDLDIAILNFALNLEYLEAEFYLRATTGAGLEEQGVAVTGTGKQGKLRVKTNPKVVFSTPAIEQYALEIAADEVAHVKFLRTALGAAAVARPGIDLQLSFTTAARAAGLIPNTQLFDPFLNETTFLAAAFIFEDVGVTAYKGASPLVTNKGYLEAAAGILAVEAYHAGIIRTLLFQGGTATQGIAQKISDARDFLDGAGDIDQGVVLNGAANLVPTDVNGLAFSRSAAQVLNIVYLRSGGTGFGGFFPFGLNGDLK